MINLIFTTLATLTLSSSHNGTTFYDRPLSVNRVQDNGLIVSYDYDNHDDDEGNTFTFPNQTYRINTQGSTIPFELECTPYLPTTSGEDGTCDIKFKVVGEEGVNTNIYLSDLNYSFYIGSTRYAYGSLPNVYFLGQSGYYEDNLSGDFTFDINNVTNLSGQWTFYCDFSIELMPSYFVDGSAYQVGYNQGYNSGYDIGNEKGYNSGYQFGYDEGFNYGISSNGTAQTIFSGILQVGLLPINFFLAIFNFEILGINLSGFIRALFTVALTVIILKTIFGGKGASE